MNSRDRKLWKGDFGYEDLTVGSSWTEIMKLQSPGICRAGQSSEKFVKSKRFSCSRWLMNVVSFLEGLRPEETSVGCTSCVQSSTSVRKAEN